MSTSWRTDTAAELCERCGGELWLRMRIALRSDPPSVRLVPLCPRCDVDEPAAQGLLAFFAANGSVGPDNVDTFTTLAAEWVGRLPRLQVVDPAAFKADCMEALNGYFDDP